MLTSFWDLGVAFSWGQQRASFEFYGPSWLNGGQNIRTSYMGAFDQQTTEDLTNTQLGV